MTWSAFLLTLLKLLPQVLALLTQLKSSADAKKNQGIGYDLAVKDALEVTTERIKKAREIEDVAAAEHAAHPNDNAGFDPDLFRKEP